MTLGSLFDGIGGWLLAAKHAGVEPIWASEIDDFPAAVTAYHFPKVKQLGDITKINVDKLEPVDIICAGSPCQDLSVAGKREGLSGERSGLFRTAIKLVHGLRARTGKPRYFVWENVPGAFSSNKGLDFAAVLEEITESEIPMPKDGRWADSGMVEWGGGSLAWRVLDAQYWGVPQRRKRIFLVADFGGLTAGEILFECQGLPRNPAESQGEGQEAAADVGTSTDSASGFKYRQGAKAGNLTARAGTGGNNLPVVHSYCIAGNTIDRQPQNGGNGNGNQEELSYTLNTVDRHAVAYSMGYDERVAAFQPNIADNLMASDYKSPPITFWDGSQTCSTLTANNAGGNQRMPDKNHFNAVISKKTVRRLTPTELRIYLQEVDINGATQGIKALYVLWENYGAKKVCEWCIAIMERIQQAKVLQQGVYEKSVSTETSQGNELDDSSLPCPEYIADWLLRDMWQQQKCGCAPQRWEPAEQFARKLNASVQKLSHKNPSPKEEMYDMWEASKGSWLLREAFTEIQKIWESFNVESWRQTKTVRRLTPLEAERLQGLPDGYTDIEFNGKHAPDSRRYKAIGNGMAQPVADFVIRRISEVVNNEV